MDLQMSLSVRQEKKITSLYTKHSTRSRQVSSNLFMVRFRFQPKRGYPQGAWKIKLPASNINDSERNWVQMVRINRSNKKPLKNEFLKTPTLYKWYRILYVLSQKYQNSVPKASHPPFSGRMYDICICQRFQIGILAAKFINRGRGNDKDRNFCGNFILVMICVLVVETGIWSHEFVCPCKSLQVIRFLLACCSLLCVCVFFFKESFFIFYFCVLK